MVRFTPEDEKLHSKVKDALQSLSKLLSPTTELYVSAEVNVQRLLSSLDDPYPCARIGIVGHKFSGKSSILNAITVADVLPPNTVKNLAVSPKPVRSEDVGSEKETEPLLFKKSTGRAIAKGVANCRQHLEEEIESFMHSSDHNTSLFAENLSDRELTIPSLPLLDPTMFHCATVEFIDCPAESCVFAPQLCQAASDVRQPNVLNADLFWNCIDSRVLTRLINVLVPHCSSDAVGIEDEDLKRSAMEAVQNASSNPVTVDLASKAANDLLYHVLSRCNANASIPTSSKATSVGITLFVLTHVDEVMNGRDRNHEEQIRSLLLQGFVELMHKTSDGEINIDPTHVIFFSAPSVKCTLRLLSQDRPSIQELYDYCEDNMGSGFMQTIDSIEEEQLRRIVARYASEEIYNRSGAGAIIERMKLADFNSAKIWLKGICLGGIECLEQLALAGESAKPALARQLVESQSHLTELLRELEWAVSTAQQVKNYCIKTMIQTQVSFANRELDNFLQNCLEDIRYVLEHRELEWYRERHACTVVEMNQSLRKLEKFTDSYMIKRAFLERKLQIRDDPSQFTKAIGAGGRRGSDSDMSSVESSKFSAHQGSVTMTHKTGVTSAAQDLDAMVERRIQQIRQSVAAMGTVEPTIVVGTNPFLEENAEEFLDALEAEKQQHLVDFFIRVCHHIRDRYEELIPSLIERLEEQKKIALSKLEALIREPVQEAFERLGVPFDIKAAMEQLTQVQLIEPNRRRLNSFLRELPEHVAAAATEISNQWYQPAQYVEVKGINATIPLVANPIPPAFQNYNNGGGAVADQSGNGSSSTSPAAIASGSAIHAIAAQRYHNQLYKQGLSSNVNINTTALAVRSSAHVLNNTNNNNTSTIPALIDPLAVPPTIGDWGRAPPERQAIFPSRPTQLPFDPNCEPHHKIHPQLLYIFETWRLTFEAIELHQVSQFNVHDLSVAATNTNNIVVDYVNGYVESLEEGVIVQKASIQEIEEAQHAMADAVAGAAELHKEFSAVLALVDRATEEDLAKAEKIARNMKEKM